MSSNRQPKGPMGRGRGMKKGPKAKNPGRTLKRLFDLVVRAYPVHCVLVILGIFVSVLANVRGSLFMQTLIDDYITPLIGAASPDFTPLLKALATMAAIYAVGVCSTYMYNRLMITVAQGSLKTIRNHLFAHMETLSIPYFDTHAHGDIMSVYTNDIDTLRQMISQSFPQLMISLIMVMTVFGLMVYYSLWMALVVVVGVVFMVTVTKKVGGNSAKYFIRQQAALGRTEGFVEEMMNGQKVIKVFCHEEESKADFDKINDGLFRDAERANRYANMLMPILGNIGNVLYVAVALTGGLLLLAGVPNVSISGLALSISIVVPFLNMTKQFAGNIGQVSNQLNAVIMGLAGAQRIFALIDEAHEADEGYVTLVNAREENGELTECEERTGMWAWKHPHSADGSVTYTKLSGEVKMFDVDFGYEPEKTVLHNITLYAEPGQKVAFVGSTGAGKTTITNLINRFYDIADGKIRYDGININKIRKSDLRRSLGIVLQDTNLFSGTVMDNIRYGKLDATDEECMEAAKLAGAHDFITRLPEGYNTGISSNGSNLSQGQRQLIAIARAAVADPPVMILDEATSSIDTRTEAIVQRGMDALMKGRTVFVIAHRLSTVRNSDVIMVLEQGHIIERGSHDKLIEEKGKYYQLYTGAFELE